VSQIEAALRENDPARAAAQIEFARANTWECRYQVLRDAVRPLYGKAAVIVVSYNNLDYLRRCLETLLAKTERPNFEVIVVDNGSEDSVVEYLQDSAKREPRLQAILNGENLGFARANNIGIQAASDADYVVLLNDDTVLTRGWLTRLLRHLDDPAVGLVGPVTNCAANEAQINTGYQALDDLESFAESYCRARVGRAFDIPMLAMYCVAMRKSLIDQIGLLDERFETGMFEDDDFSLRARRAGFRIVCAEDAFVHHWGRASFSRMDQRQYDRLFDANRKKFEAKWGLQWQPHRYRSQS
jgi:GT2 family glycosyltransferase